MTNETEQHTEAEFEQELIAHDEWFRHSTTEPHHQQAHGETKSSVIMLFLLGTVIFVFGTGYLVLLFFTAEGRRLLVDIQERSTPVQEYQTAVADWNRQLSEPGWVDREAGVVRVPLDVATEKVIAEYKGVR